MLLETSLISTEQLQEERNRWFSLEYINSRSRPEHGNAISSSSLLIELDIRLSFIGGAWLSVIVLAQAAVEAQLRHVVIGDYESTAHRLFKDDPDLTWLRNLRNEILHALPPGVISEVWKSSSNDFCKRHQALEEDAKRSVSIMFRKIYGSQTS